MADNKIHLQSIEELEAESATHFGWALEMQERAWTAEAEVERLRLTIETLWATEPWQIADELAEALKTFLGPTSHPKGCGSVLCDALARYEEARRGA